MSNLKGKDNLSMSQANVCAQDKHMRWCINRASCRKQDELQRQPRGRPAGEVTVLHVMIKSTYALTTLVQI